MIPDTLPDSQQLVHLAESRVAGSVSIHLPSSPIPLEAGGARVALRNAAREAAERLERQGFGTGDRDLLLERLHDLADDEEFWQRQSGQGVVVLCSDGSMHAYAVPHPITTDRIAVGDRYALGPLLQASGATDRAWLLALARGDVHLYRLERGRHPDERDLALPGGLDGVFDHADNQGGLDRQRAGGSDADKPEQERWAKAVRDAVLAVVGDAREPLLLASGPDLARAYRAVDTSDRLLAQGLPHLEHGRLGELSERAWTIVDAHLDQELSDWRERFGDRRAEGLATTKVPEVALAATGAAIDELLFDTDAVVEGAVDELGAVQLGEAAAEPRYNVIEEIAARVVATGGRVRGVPNAKLVDGSPVAAVLRYPISV
jgi:hypothetical protein